MTTNTTAQIATFLNVSPNQIKSITEMAWVYCVVVKGQRARFVSKKVVKEVTMSKPITKAEQKRDTKELVFSGSDYRVVFWVNNNEYPYVTAFDAESEAREYFDMLDAREVVSMY